MLRRVVNSHIISQARSCHHDRDIITPLRTGVGVSPNSIPIVDQEGSRGTGDQHRPEETTYLQDQIAQLNQKVDAIQSEVIDMRKIIHSAFT